MVSSLIGGRFPHVPPTSPPPPPPHMSSCDLYSSTLYFGGRFFFCVLHTMSWFLSSRVWLSLLIPKFVFLCPIHPTLLIFFQIFCWCYFILHSPTATSPTPPRHSPLLSSFFSVSHQSALLRFWLFLALNVRSTPPTPL